MDSGIYRILCAGNGKFYAGSSQELSRRKVYHWNRLRANSHPNPHLQSAYNLYGEESFTFEIVKTCPMDALLAEEQAEIDTFWDAGVLFNIARIAGASFRNRRHAKETIEKMKKSHTRPWAGKHLSADHKDKIRQKRLPLSRRLRKLNDDQVREVRILSAAGTSSRKIARQFGVSRPLIERILSGRRYVDVI